ncbi:MAG TPA: ABC transporter ATP-binding protein [Burkholderiales bacterium]|nr:ABC transporter ATP-binding protein [Burkholderiales bacterium]
MLEIRRLNAGYGRARILFDLDLDARHGEVVVLLGRNGAGKSTVLKTIIGLVRPTSGEIRFAGKRIDRLQPFQIARLGIGYVPEDRRIFTDLTVAENLEVGRRPARADATHWTSDKLFRLFPNLAEMRNRRGAHMSGGEQQMLTIARTLMGNPRAVLLDEPSEGLAPLIVQQMARTVLQLKQEGLTVLLCEQNLRFAQAVADRAFVLEKGHVRYSGAMRALEADAALREQYLSL